MALPPEVITCLQNARFLHLSTCSDNTPHISLMNYTYLPSSPYTSSPSIIMTTTPSSRKTDNLLANPRVSLLVHDWVSHRPPTLQSTSGTTAPAAAPPTASQPTDPSAPSSSPLADLLRNLNMSSLSRISTTINGTASLIPSNTPAEAWLKARHLENNTFGPPSSSSSQRNGAADPLSFFSSSPVEERGAGRFMRGGAEEAEAEADGGKRCYIEGEEVRVVVVRIRDGRIADWKGGYKDWTVPEGEAEEGLVNGV